MGKIKEKQDGNKNNSVPHTQISIRLPVELLEQLQRMAKQEHRNRSNMIEWLLREVLRDMGEK